MASSAPTLPASCLPLLHSTPHSTPAVVRRISGQSGNPLSLRIPVLKPNTPLRSADRRGAHIPKVTSELPSIPEASSHPNSPSANEPSLSRRCLIGGTLALSPFLADVAPAHAEAGRAQLGPSPLTNDDDELASKVFEACTRSVAAIILLKGEGRGGEEEKAGTGSGIVWDKYGHIVTNYHVIAKVLDNKADIRCVVSLLKETGGSITLDGTVIGIDPTKDLAVVKVDASPEEMSPAALGRSEELRVGQSCFAVGNPYGYLHTLTAGVVSGLGRAIPSPAGQAISGAIQTDAAINSGNSGGPLLDSSGRVIGINTATFTRSGSGTSSGVNFAVPVDTVVKVVPKIIVYGTPTRYINSLKREGGLNS